MVYFFLTLFSIPKLFFFYAYSKREKNYLNPLLIIFIFPLITCYFLPALNILFLRNEFELTYGFFVFFGLFLVYDLVIFLILFSKRNFNFETFKNKSNNHNPFSILSITLILISILFIALIFKETILIGISPREFYTLSRFGGGHYYFISSSLLLISITFSLFLNNKIISSFLYIFILLSIFMLGSKTSFFNVFFITIFYLIYIKKISFFDLKFPLIILISSILLIISIYFNNSLSDFPVTSLIYSDFTFNGIFLIDNFIDHGYGVRFFEDNFYSRIPRLLFEFKPIYFGSQEFSFFINEKQSLYFSGYPSYSIAYYYAEYGLYSFLIIGMVAFFKGFFLKLFSENVYKSPNISNFVLFLYLSGIKIINVPPAWTFIETFILAMLFYLFTKKNN